MEVLVGMLNLNQTFLKQGSFINFQLDCQEILTLTIRKQFNFLNHLNALNRYDL